MPRSAFLAWVLTASCALGCTPPPRSSDSPPPPVVQKSSPFEVMRVDDSIDAFVAIADDQLPAGAGLAKFQEAVSLGAGHFALSHFVRIISRSGEPLQSTLARFVSWQQRTVRLPAGATFGFEELFETDGKGPASSIGYRTFVLTGTPVIDEHDIAEAFVTEGDEDVPEISIAMKLTLHGSQKLQLATAAWIGRRLAIVSEGKIQSAPVVRAEIEGGHLQVALGPRSGAIVAQANLLVSEILQK